MKSEKAREAIERYRSTFSAPYEAAETAEYCRLFREVAELAEQEAEERMRQKAISAFDDMWFENGEDGEFEPDYEYHRKNFIQKLNEK